MYILMAITAYYNQCSSGLMAFRAADAEFSFILLH